MTRSRALLEDVFRLLPELAELEELRLSLVAVATPDPEKEWERSSSLATFDKRVVTREQAATALREAEEKLVTHVRERFNLLEELLGSLWEGGDDGDAPARLVSIGELEEKRGRVDLAMRLYAKAVDISLALSDHAGQTLALRRLARSCMATGDLDEASEHYKRSAEIARAADDAEGEVVAVTGLGNVCAVQGWWRQAEEHYRRALARLTGTSGGADGSRQLGQLYNNLALTALRRGDAEGANRWIEKALEFWEQVSSPEDLAICYNSLAMLRDQEGQAAEAAAVRHRALELDITFEKRATIAIDLAQGYAAEGHWAEAHHWGREAERHAIAARSPYHLGHMYRGLGNIARLSGDADGFVFFEKALEIARTRQLPYLEAETLLDYAVLRAANGGSDEAVAYISRALALFTQLGAKHEEKRAREALLEIGRISLRPEQL